MLELCDFFVHSLICLFFLRLHFHNFSIVFFLSPFALNSVPLPTSVFPDYIPPRDVSVAEALDTFSEC